MPGIDESLLTKKMEMGLESPSTPVMSAASGSAGPAPEPIYPVYNRFLATPLPIVATYQPDALRQFYRGGIPQQRIFPPNG
jgi:hypothetical protein